MTMIKVKRALMPLLFMILLCLSVLAASGVLRQKKSAYYKDGFFREERDYDILFFGSSHMHEGVDPIALWEDWGIASYNLASSAESMQITWYVVRAALEKYRPGTIMLDTFKIFDSPDTLDQQYGFVHESLDALPMGKIKAEAILYAGRFLPEGVVPFFSPLYAYHGRYGELTKEDFAPEKNCRMGAFLLTGICPTDARTVFQEGTKELKGGEGVQAYRKLLALCKELGIRVILTDIPANGSSYRGNAEQRTNALMEETKAAGGFVLRFDRERTERIGLDYSLDFGDQTHLNLMGSRKVTDEIEDFLQKELQMEDHRQDPAYASWEEILRLSTEEKIRLFGEKEEAVSCLFQVQDPAYEVRVYVKKPKQIQEHYGLSFCLDRMGIEAETAGEEILGGNDMKIEVRRSGSGEWCAGQYLIFDEARREYRVPEGI